MQFPSADLDAFLEDGEVVANGTDTPTKGHFRVSEVAVELERGGLTAVELHPNVVLRADALPASTRHSTITVGGTSYTVRDILPMANNQFKRWLLVEVMG